VDEKERRADEGGAERPDGAGGAGGEEGPTTEQREPVVYASPVKRLWAWVGVVYMLILVGINTYALSTGTYLTGIGALATVPALCGLGGTVILRQRAGQGRGTWGVCAILAGTCFALALWGLIRGLPALLEQL